MKHSFDLHARTPRAIGRKPAGFRPRRRRIARIELVTMVLAGVLGGLVWARLPDAPLERPAPVGLSASSEASTVRAAFSICHRGGGGNCVVDGDTFWMGGVKIRIADIDAPETHPPRCAHEAALGEAATRRLQALLNGGAISLAPIDRDSDRYGRKLRRVSVDGRGVGETLVGEGLARWYEGGRRAGWCD